MSTMEATPLPHIFTVRTILSDLVGKDVDLTEVSLPLDVNGKVLIASYVNDFGRLAAVVVTDWPGGSRLGGALALVPPATINEDLKDGSLADYTYDCAYEVLNILASAFNVGDAQHVRLDDVYRELLQTPSDVRNLATQTVGRVDFRINVQGYGDGYLSVVIRG